MSQSVSNKPSLKWSWSGSREWPVLEYYTHEISLKRLKLQTSNFVHGFATRSTNLPVFEWEKRRTGTLCLPTPKARGVSMQLRDLGECCKLSQRVRGSPAAKRHLVHFCLKMLYPARPSLAEMYAWWSFTMSRVVPVPFEHCNLQMTNCPLSGCG